MLATPVVMIAFNRPELAARTLEAIRRARPSRLFLVADGPRRDRPEDQRLCAEVRRVLDGVDWPCTVERRYADRNLGLEANVELGLDWVFSQVDRAIVLEDDCIPDPTFFNFCGEMLDRYAADGRIWLVSGETHGADLTLFRGDSYAFTTWASVWGWATWANRWRRHRLSFDRDHGGAEVNVATASATRAVPMIPAPGALVTRSARKHFTFVATNLDGDAYGWDHHFWVTIMANQGLSITPATNMIANDGYGEGATHTRAAKDALPTEPMIFPLIHPPEVTMNRNVEAELELILLRTDGRLSRLARRVIRPLWLRAIFRRISTNRFVWRAVRATVRK